ncbi:MAG TPA: uroporphyrinogen-III C-methyltransferase [Noviherbaspirillum sp.]|uniref:uroporphyrinogen-III C-methyltransferase n=1 Tax=Noviherbaspirillum sp. TaxID=1926288 RepID=UPI002D52B2F4|nr:uroporphyrinogen-III C-methyltransferase [Noviherbaspirillum sp.]HYD93889.1 uroporphyrinogen-III C-methyltransferase [Noviherbaspirillum sp.]
MPSLAPSTVSSVTSTRPPGKVFLVGAGPGDPDLLTLRAARLLGAAEVIVYDHLVGAGILELVNNSAERIYAGKQNRCHTLSQDEINGLLVRLASQGRNVVRLKGGDPFIFGRGGEELETLAAHGIPFEVVPGVTAASGVSCYAGIPLTHRDYAQSCIFTTGHLKDGSLDLDWPTLARPRQTVVIYMGLNALPEIARQLIAHGQSPDMPAAVVEKGTTRQQRVAVGTLAAMPDLVAALGLQSPCLIIIGEVTALHRKLQWFTGATGEVKQEVFC